MTSTERAQRGVRILIVDDQPRARQSLRALLSTWPQVAEIREAADGSEALRMIEADCPDLLLIDAKMPVLDGVEATRRVKERWPEVLVIVLSMSSLYADQAREAGAEAFAAKGDLSEQLRAILAAVETCAERLRETQDGDGSVASPGEQG